MQQIFNKNDAEIFIIKVLTFLAQDSEALKLFLDVTGLRIETVREAAENSNFFVGVLSFLETHEKILIEFCQAFDYDPKDFYKIEQLLK